MAIKTLKEFRKQYPQYNDMSDVELADALHAKYYADMPKQEFLQTIEVAAPSIQKTLPAKKEERSLFGVTRGARDKRLQELGLGEFRPDSPASRGGRQGIDDVLATLQSPFYNIGNKLGITDKTGEQNRAEMFRKNTEGVDITDPSFTGMRTVGNVAATWPVGGVVGSGIKALAGTNALRTLAPAASNVLSKLGTATGTGGLSSLGGVTTGEKLANAAIRVGGGAVSGGAITGAINPDDWLEGAGIGAAIPVGGAALKGLYNFGANATGPLREAWRTAKVRDLLAKELGGSEGVQRVINAVKSNVGDFLPGTPQTLADRIAAANVGKTTKAGAPLIAMENALAVDPKSGAVDLLKSIKATQEAGRAQAIGNIAGSPVLKDAAERARRAITAPMREETFARADVGEQIPKVLNPLKAANEAAATEAVGDVRRFTAAGERAKDLSKTWTSSVDKAEGVVRRPIQYTYPGQLAGKAEEVAQGAADQSLVSGNLAKVNQAQLENLQALGIKPVDLNGFISKIEQLKNEPGSSAVTEIQNLLQRIQNKAQELVQRGGGVANVRDIDAIRKSELSNIVNELANAKGVGGDKTHMAGVVGKLKDDLINIIDESAGGGYRNYLQTFSNLSKPINEMEVAGGLKAALRPPTGTENPAGFLQEVSRLENEIDPETGVALIHKLSPESKVKVTQTANELARDVERGGLAQGVQTDIRRDVMDESATLPGLINKVISTANFVGKMLARDARGQINTDMINLMAKDPNGFIAKYLEQVPPTQRELFMNTVKDAALNAARVVIPASNAPTDTGEQVWQEAQ